MSDTETQDLHVAVPAQPDQNWARMQPMSIQPTPARLDKPHQIVSIKNTSDITPGPRGIPHPQKHIIIDRYNQGHELQPGETKHDIDMLAVDIEYFIRERQSGRRDQLGRAKPRHPIEIVGLDPARVLRETPAQRETLTVPGNKK